MKSSYISSTKYIYVSLPMQIHFPLTEFWGIPDPIPTPLEIDSLQFLCIYAPRDRCLQLNKNCASF